MSSNEYWVMDTIVDGKPKHAVIFFDSDHTFDEAEELPDIDLVKGEIPKSRRGKIDKIVEADGGIVVHKDVKEFLDKAKVDNIQYFNLEFKDEKGNAFTDYFIANIKSTTQITDVDASDIVWWGEDNDRFEHVFKWVLDFEKIKQSKHKIFRPRGDYQLIVVSDEIKKGIENMGITSVKFTNTKEWKLDA